MRGDDSAESDFDHDLLELQFLIHLDQEDAAVTGDSAQPGTTAVDEALRDSRAWREDAAAKLRRRTFTVIHQALQSNDKPGTDAMMVFNKGVQAWLDRES